MCGADGVERLIEFRDELAGQMRRAGFRVPRSYTPHMTLLWGDRCVGDHPMPPVGWMVRDFVLIRSLIGQSRHVELGRWCLH
jgi:2'-5' RNA ligase